MVLQNVRAPLFSKAALVGFSVSLAFLMAACDHTYSRKDEYTGSLYKFAHTNHPIHVDRGVLSMAIAVGGRDRKLLPEKRDELQMFLNYYRNQGTGRITVQMPVRPSAQASIEQVAHEMQREMEDMSIGPESLRVRKYVSRDAYPVIRLSFERYVAKASECGGWNQNLGQDENNGNSDYWGCAMQNNLAAMVANPRDLKGPRGWSPRDARRRDKVFDKHIKGEVTGAQRSNDERVDVSGIQQN